MTVKITGRLPYCGHENDFGPQDFPLVHRQGIEMEFGSTAEQAIHRHIIESYWFCATHSFFGRSESAHPGIGDARCR